ncbi:MAG: 16S rRNA (guanine(966)-N(2))-methyltransferase RsmD [Clostridia bacterium]|nr:16S rRNA (guanine(966)-N(2))-methyltransferase RsmD [Clostridia bacterium]MBO4428563.1 16S rRNA (guanine(966)-N(2))-methyltransferase RsmD [Clostridia bacterium]
MRVITGTARGRKLATLPGEDITRPTLEVVKEAVFSSIQFDLEGRTMLDLFAGSGQMGIEALSRGAAKATFIDVSRDAVSIITQNLQKTDLYAQANVICTDWRQYVNSAKGRYKFDFVFLDPPYSTGMLAQAAAEVYDAGLLKETSVVICEDEKRLDMTDPLLSERYILKKDARYGRAYVSYLLPKEAGK